jgi:hypothetical protein
VEEFTLGDRVRVRATPGTVLHAGRTGEVTWVGRGPDGALLDYHVRLDGDPANSTLTTYIVFGPGELEPEGQGTP